MSQRTKSMATNYKSVGLPSTAHSGSTKTMMTSRSCVSGTPVLPGIPSRYEETRSAIVQDFAHQKIISIGDILHVGERLHGYDDRNLAVRDTQEREWDAAEKRISLALEKLRQQLDLKHQQRLLDMEKEQSLKLKEHGESVEKRLMEELSSRLTQERAEGNEATRCALQRTEEECELKKQTEMQKAREEEISYKHQQIDQVCREEEKRLKDTVAELKEKENKEISALTKFMNEKRAVELEKCARMHAERLEILLEAERRTLESSIASLDSQLKALICSVKRANEQNEKANERGEELCRLLTYTHEQFVQFVDTCGLFDYGHSQFIVTPLNALDE